MTMRWLFQWFTVVLVGGGFAAGAQGDQRVGSSDAPVYDAVLVLMQFRKEQPRILINEKTLNSGCGESSGNTVLMNGCGIFIQGSTASEVGDAVRESMPGLDQPLWADFTNQVKTSINLTEPVHTSWPHAVVDLNIPATNRWKSP